MDLTTFGLDAGMVMATNQLTNWVKGKLKEWTWDDKFHRFYPLVPFLCAFVPCILIHQSLWPAMKCAVLYGLWSTLTWRGYKVAIRRQ